jgi:hypothetical protein
MLVCTRPICYHDGYTEVRCLPDTTIVADESDVVARFPDSFKLLDPALVGPCRDRYLATASPMRMRSASEPAVRPGRFQCSDLPAEPRGREPWRLIEGTESCKVSTHRKSDLRVRFGPNVRAALDGGIRASTGTDGLEWGVVMFGAITTENVELVAITDGPGPNASRTVGSLTFDPRFVADEITRARSRGLHAVAVAHVHPRLDDQAGEAAPSRQDVRVLESWRAEWADADKFLGIIASRTRTGWTLTGWLLDGDDCLLVDL